MRGCENRRRLERFTRDTGIVRHQVVDAVAILEMTQHGVDGDARASYDRRATQRLRVGHDIGVPRCPVARRRLERFGGQFVQMQHPPRRELDRLEFYGLLTAKLPPKRLLEARGQIAKICLFQSGKIGDRPYRHLGGRAPTQARRAGQRPTHLRLYRFFNGRFRDASKFGRFTERQIE